MQFFPVEYSTLSTIALSQLLESNYNSISYSSITFLKRGFNDTYLITVNRRVDCEEDRERFADGVNAEKNNSNILLYILRVYKHNWRKIESIETELELLSYIKENNGPVSFPIKDNHGKFIQSIHAPEGIRYAVLFSFAEGKPVRKLSVEQSFLLGIETGKIHSFTQNKSFGLCAHNYDIETQFEITLTTLKSVLLNHPEQYQYLVQLKEDFIKLFNTIDKKKLRKGICHGDLQAENFHITLENKFTFFDFDFFGTGYLVYDIGVFMWYDHKNKTPEIMDAFLKGYQTQEKLSLTELKLIPCFRVYDKYP